jgi:putative acetyltransferase
MNVFIRPEKPGDEPGIAEVNHAAFGQTAEAALVDELRRVANPYISFVADHDDNVVGHILFTPVSIRGEHERSDAIGLGPMAVTLDHQRCGVGAELVRAGLDECARRSHPVVFVLGHPEYYPRFGFRPAPPLGLRFRSPDFDTAFMVAELVPGALSGRKGWVEYLPAFDEV